MRFKFNNEHKIATLNVIHSSVCTCRQSRHLLFKIFRALSPWEKLQSGLSSTLTNRHSVVGLFSLLFFREEFQLEIETNYILLAFFARNGVSCSFLLFALIGEDDDVSAWMHLAQFGCDMSATR